MGAWGAGTLENDNAMDFLAGFEDEPEVDALLEIFEAVTEAEYIDADDAFAAIAAAEIVAAMQGKGSPRLPKEIKTWAAENKPDAELLAAAKAALAAVPQSEAGELWEDSPETDRWLANLKNLTDRIG
jgi:hypothetical protein